MFRLLNLTTNQFGFTIDADQNQSSGHDRLGRAEPRLPEGENDDFRTGLSQPLFYFLLFPPESAVMLCEETSSLAAPPLRWSLSQGRTPKQCHRGTSRIHF
jgi:hypothetical protein